MVRGSVTSLGGTTVKLGESTDTDVLSEVDVSGNGGWMGGISMSSRKERLRIERQLHQRHIDTRKQTWKFSSVTRETEPLTSSDVVPVGVVRGKLLVGTGLDGVNPVGDFELTGSLEVRRVSRDERVGAEKVRKTIGVVSYGCYNEVFQQNATRHIGEHVPLLIPAFHTSRYSESRSPPSGIAPHIVTVDEPIQSADIRSPFFLAPAQPCQDVQSLD